MDYCTTFHWDCLLDPFYLIGVGMVLVLDLAIVAFVAYLIGFPILKLIRLIKP